MGDIWGRGTIGHGWTLLTFLSRVLRSVVVVAVATSLVLPSVSFTSVPNELRVHICLKNLKKWKEMLCVKK